MILDFKLRTDVDTIRATAPQVELDTEIKNMVGVHTRTRQIVAIGDSADDIKANAPQFWERTGSQIHFVHPFNFAAQREQGEFDPLIAVRIIQYLSNNAFNRMKRQGARRLLLSPWVDRVNYDLDMAGFETLPPATRRQFIKYLKRLLVAPRRVRINGQTVIGRDRD